MHEFLHDILRPRENPQTPHLKRPLISRPTRQPFFGFSRGQSIKSQKIHAFSRWLPICIIRRFSAQPNNLNQFG